MKKLIVIALIVSAYSCRPTIKNDHETLEKVFNMSDFDLQIIHWGCFGSNEENFTVNKADDGYMIKSKSTGKSYLVPQTKMDSLKNYLKLNIGKTENGICTNHVYIRLGSFFNSIDCSYADCSFNSEHDIKRWINHSNLINEKE